MLPDLLTEWRFFCQRIELLVCDDLQIFDIYGDSQDSAMEADLPTTTGIPVDLPVFAKSTGTTGGSNFSTVFCCQQCFLLFFRGLRKNLRERPVINYNCM